MSAEAPEVRKRRGFPRLCEKIWGPALVYPGAVWLAAQATAQAQQASPTGKNLPVNASSLCSFLSPSTFFRLFAGRGAAASSEQQPCPRGD